MRYILQHIKAITDTYTGALSLSHFLKGYYRQFPKLGSRDRRILNDMTYSWYRCSKAIEFEGAYLGSFDDMVKACLQATGNDAITSRVWGSGDVPPFRLNMSKIFPFECPLSPGIANEEWLQSLLRQPALFIRIRKQKDKVLSSLTDAGIPFTMINDHCVSLPNGAKIDALLPADCYVVQDASSQQTGTSFAPRKKEQWYDCCSGAGGKSLLLKDLEPTIDLTISDIRQSIISNLLDRFRLYGHKLPATYITDVADGPKTAQMMRGKQFDAIIGDVPCSGSGTWARTPEQLYFFDPLAPTKFAALQERIATNAAAYLKPGGRLFYITCSVFKAENEDVVDCLRANTNLELMSGGLINGTGINADSMFIAMLQRPV